MLGLKCEICGHREKTNLKKHLQATHNLTTKQYRTKYPNSKTMTGHSKRTVEYWIYREGYSYEQAKKAVEEFQRLGKKNYIKGRLQEGFSQEQAQELWNDKQAKCSPRSLKYYTGRGVSIDKAKKAQSKLQAKYSALSSKFTGHKHTKKAKEQISKKSKQRAEEIGYGNMAKRFRNKSQNGIRSSIEIQCYKELKEIFPKLKANVEINTYVVDMVLDNIVIEFYGDFWHRNPKHYLAEDVFYGKSSKIIWEYDKKRLYYIKQQGYDVVVVWETDWKSNKHKVVEQIKKLYESN